ncbi:MAG: hypothetical protein MHMPM18_001818 [Marteilia pararefringens]
MDKNNRKNKLTKEEIKQNYYRDLTSELFVDDNIEYNKEPLEIKTIENKNTTGFVKSNKCLTKRQKKHLARVKETETQKQIRKKEQEIPILSKQLARTAKSNALASQSEPEEIKKKSKHSVKRLGPYKFHEPLPAVNRNFKKLNGPLINVIPQQDMLKECLTSLQRKGAIECRKLAKKQKKRVRRRENHLIIAERQKNLERLSSL